MKKKWVDENPAVELKAPKVPYKPTTPVTREEMIPERPGAFPARCEAISLKKRRRHAYDNRCDRRAPRFGCVMRLANFADLISKMPVSNQAFASKRSTWSRFTNGNDAADAALQPVFDAYSIDSEHIFLSRGDLRDLGLKPHLAAFVMATIIWGYPREMRGHNFKNVTNHLDALCQLPSHLERLVAQLEKRA
jgi:hypothetical protein